MTPAGAGYVVGFIVGFLFIISIGAVIGAAVLKLACHICGERDVTFGHAIGIVLVNGLVQMGISAVISFGILPQVGSDPSQLLGLYLGTLVVNMLVASAIISAMVPTTYPKAMAIWLMQFVVVGVAIGLIVLLVLALSGRSFSPRTPSSQPAGSVVASSVPDDARFLTDVLADLKSLEGSVPGGGAVSSLTPPPGGGAVNRPPTPRGGAPGTSGSQFTRPDAEASGGFTPQVLVWQVRPDPPAEEVEIPADKAVRIPVPPNFFASNDVLFPTTASPFVAVGKNSGDDTMREVWDLRTGQRAGRLRGKIGLDEKPMALSPDGQTLAGKVGFKNSVQVWSLATGRMLGQVDLARGTPDFFDFAGPDRLVVGSSSEKVIEVWDITQGRKLHEIQTPAPLEREAVAISPGYKYLAGASKQDSMLRVFDLQTGQVAGEETLPKDASFGMNPQGMAFSPDGSELAAVFESFGKVRILCWSVADGRVVADFNFDDKSGVKKAFGYEDRGLQWIPGLDAWLVFGEAVIDRTTGQKVHSFPFDRENFQPGPRRPLGGGRMLVVYGKQTRTVNAAEIPPQVVKALEIARAGGSVVDAQLPPLTAADRSQARTVPAPTGAVAWSVAPDPAPAGKTFVSRPISLRSQNGEPRRILFSAPDAAVVLVSNQAGGPFGSQENQPRWLDRYDLTNGKHLGRLDIPAVSEPIAVSPDGTLALVADAQDHTRLDVWSVVDKKPVAGWRPYETEAGEDRAVVWAAFLDAQNVLTINKPGTLVLWGVPSCQAVYVAETGGPVTPALSPGRNVLALGAGGRVRFLDPKTAEPKGEAVPSAAQGNLEMKAAAFSTDGRELLALRNETLVRCDLATGRVVSEFRSPVGGGTQLEWCGPRHVLIDNQKLVALDTQRHVWSYFGPTAATAGPDGLHWFAAEVFPSPAPVLAALELPTKDVDRVQAQAADPKVPALLRAGGKVSLELSLSGPPKDPEGFRKALTDQLKARLQAVGVTVADGQPVRLVVSLQEVDTGETLELRKMFSRPGENPFATRSITIKNLEYQISIADAQGSIPLVPKQTLSMRTFGIIHLPPGEDVETHLRGQMWDSARSRVTFAGMPYYLARGPEGLITLPGTSNLNQPPR